MSTASHSSLELDEDDLDGEDADTGDVDGGHVDRGDHDHVDGDDSSVSDVDDLGDGCSPCRLSVPYGTTSSSHRRLFISVASRRGAYSAF